MNQYNNDGYEIIDSNTSPYPTNRNNQYSNSRYPYTNNPNQSMQHTNYEDSLIVSQNIQQYNSCADNSSSTDWTPIISTGLIVGGTLLSALVAPVAIPVGIGAVLISVGTVLPILWPGGTNDNNRNWENFILQGSAVTCEVITTVVKDLVNTALNGLKQQYHFYNDALKYWKANPNDVNAKNNVQQIFISLYQSTIDKMSIFSMQGYETLLLSAYTGAALLQITLLAEGIQYADQWGLARNSGDFYRDQLYKSISKHIEHCEIWYKNGLNKLKSRPNIRWGAITNYRREYTLSVLNIIATFPAFDLRVYPLKEQIGLQAEFTQELFTISPDVQNFQNLPTILNLENELIPRPDLVRHLKRLSFFTRTTAGNLNNYLESITNESYRTNNNSTHLDNYGNFNNQNQGSNLTLTNPDQVIYFADILHHAYYNPPTIFGTYGIRAIDFKIGTNRQISQTLRYSSNTNPGGSIHQIYAPFPPTTQSTNLTNYQYILSRITMTKESYPIWGIGTFESTKIYGFNWIHASLNLTNSISSINPIGKKKITQISAVKAFDIDGGSVIEGPGHTGGNLVELKRSNYIKISCKIIDSAVYNLRIRYTSNTATAETNGIRITVIDKINKRTSNYALKNTIRNPQRPTSYDNFEYLNIETFSFYGTDPNIEIMLENMSSGIITIDKLEFTPQ
ncbi:insecticidal delta-endotoxin Cry8Ea1 family protein [Bacillus mycoides]|uniref:insecticidal delta-endotoxin Cry8Ea1 family protein n=1 Tax=Bacillus mycoides TaxID=1405 RepID=UPI002E24F491|nr:insecticidal delta-endotoxin Cry8Ea1 family protein [Bacillus mycoides]MED1382642.1 insecticidal delta-endotoxin Cry8Ea1 family protein [Bacillus mycoides]